jgi:acetyl esterase/lipase
MYTKTFNIYEGRDDVTLTAYVLEPTAQMIGTAARPAVIVNPGGGLIKPSKREGEPIALRFASMGFHAFVLNYSTYNFVGTDATFPNQIIENALAMDIIHEHADEWHVDTDVIGICGFSIGGHSAAMYGTHWDQPLIQEAVEIEHDKLKPAFLILGYPILDFTSIDNILNLPRIVKLAFGTDHPSKEEAERYSPHLHVDENTPPTFIWGTYTDEVVGVADSLKFVQAMADKGRPFEFHVFENGPHNLSSAKISSAKSHSHINPIAATWFPLAEQWLEKRFIINKFRIDF